jgi:hypothetical protein
MVVDGSNHVAIIRNSEIGLAGIGKQLKNDFIESVKSLRTLAIVLASAMAITFVADKFINKPAPASEQKVAPAQQSQNPLIQSAKAHSGSINYDFAAKLTERRINDILYSTRAKQVRMMMSK